MTAPAPPAPPAPPARPARLARPALQLVRPRPTTVRPPALDEAQQRVVAHRGGPLLVLAGPGAGKTTTLVEAVAASLDDGLAPDELLVLTFSRKAALELRARVAARVGRTTREPLALTFHSYAFALLRASAAADGLPPPRLLSGPEQDLVVRQLLAGEVEDGARRWPASLRPALSTRGFAAELRDLLLRARERGWDPEVLEVEGIGRGRPEWVAAAHFWRAYEARFALDATGGEALDYAELVQRAARLLEDAGPDGAERRARRAVFVDEYQDVDPAQEQLLTALAGGGRHLVAVGDPDQSIYGFRGADVGAILSFPERFRHADGRPADVVALRTCRRFRGPALEATRRVAARLPAGGLPGVAAHRAPVAVPGPATSVQVLLAESVSAEAAVVADVLRRAHLLGAPGPDGPSGEPVPWSRMAVLVRSSARSLPVLRRALAAAGVPSTVAGDEVPLAEEPGVRPLLLALRAALVPTALDEDVAVELLLGPLGGTDALGVRRLRRALREVALRDGDVRPSSALLVQALRTPEPLTALPERVAAPVVRLAGLLRTAEEAGPRGVEEALWALWDASGLAERWEEASLRGGEAGRAADRDLDAVVSLFDAAARFVDRLPRGAPTAFLDDLEGREIPGDTLAEQAPAGDAVRLLTAHRAKGLEWDVVVVAGVQEGMWPDLRLRGSVLGSEELVHEGAVSRGAVREVTPTELVAGQLAEERRLFYVACTRARRALVVTAVGGADDAEERPSRFLDELCPPADGAQARAVAAPRALDLRALVAELRAVVTDPDAEAGLREGAAERLARLAAVGVPGADPGTWWALRPVSDDRPVAAPDEDVRVSPSVVESVATCSLRWLLERAAGGGRPPAAAQSVGSLVHALAALAVDPGLPEAERASEDELTRRLDTVWERLDLGGPWFSARQREAAQRMLRLFLAWHRDNGRELVAVERSFEVRDGRAVLRGQVDRLERDAAGRGVVVDLKTGSSKPKPGELPRQPQLGVYQRAVALGAFADDGLTEPGGAELVQLGKAALSDAARRQPQPPLDDDPDDPAWAEALVASAAETMAGGTFVATAGDHCRHCPVRRSCPLQPEGAGVVP